MVKRMCSSHLPCRTVTTFHIWVRISSGFCLMFAHVFAEGNIIGSTLSADVFARYVLHLFCICVEFYRLYSDTTVCFNSHANYDYGQSCLQERETAERCTYVEQTSMVPPPRRKHSKKASRLVLCATSTTPFMSKHITGFSYRQYPYHIVV